MATTPPPPVAAFSSSLPPLLVAPPAVRDADSIQSDRGNDADLHGALNLSPSREAAEEEGSKRRDPVVFLDSGASHHATSDRWFLSDLAMPRVRTELPIVGVGSVVTEKFQLPYVHFTPELVPGTVVVSVQQLASWGYYIMFGDRRCLVMKRAGGKPFGEGRLQVDDGLYRLDFLKIPLDAATPQMERIARSNEAEDQQHRLNQS